MKVKILRQQSPDADKYWETFDADVSGEMSVAGLLDYLNYRDDIVDEHGNPTTRIIWECSCLQGVCGACAMVINGMPALACETFIKNLKGDIITIRPLQKFPVIRDLMVDRSLIQENLKKADVCIEKYRPDAGGISGQTAEMQKPVSSRKKRKAEKAHEHEYTAAKCLKCGLCLEVCPNYVNGQNFYGAIFANDCYLVAARNKDKSDKIRKIYREHFGRGCSKALSCMDVCPMRIPTLASMSKLNRPKW